MGLTEERDMLLNRIRENREHFHMLCSPGGIFHSAMTPRQQSVSSPQQYRATPKAHRGDDREHGLSALLQAMSQDNNSAPSTPLVSHRSVQRHAGKHNRNAQSMSSLPTTPLNRGRDGGLLPSVDLVPQTEPRARYSAHSAQKLEPTSTPTPKPDRRRKSRESTISAEDTEELARQAVELAAGASQGSRANRSRREDQDEEEVFDSQASQAATELLRRDPRQSFEVASSAESRGHSPAPLEKSARMQAKLFASNLRGGAVAGADKRKFSSSMEEERASPKKSRVGLGIEYGHH